MVFVFFLEWLRLEVESGREAPRQSRDDALTALASDADVVAVAQAVERVVTDADTGSLTPRPTQATRETNMPMRTTQRWLTREHALASLTTNA